MSFVIIEKDDNYLLVSEASPKWKGKWFFPGGHADKDEDPVSAAIRETKEEAECEVVLDGLFYFKLRKVLWTNTLHLYYHGRTNKPVVKTEPDRHSLGSKWFTYEELLSLPLRGNALHIINIYRALKTTLPVYCFDFSKDKTPQKIDPKDFTSF